MAKSAREIPKKNRFSVRGAVMLLLLLVLSIGGVIAHLSTASNLLDNDFAFEAYPSVTVNDGSITVNHEGYAVYLRATVVVNWEKEGKILAEDPELGTDYTLRVEGDGAEKWFHYDNGGDGFYYYNQIIVGQDSADTSVNIAFPLSVQAAADNRHADYQLKTTVLAQVVQAVGTTDEEHTPPNKDAVFDAWRVEASEFIGKSNIGKTN